MAAIEFRLPKGAILFSADGFSYEFRENLGEAHHGLSHLLVRKRTAEGHPRESMLLKAVGTPSGPGGRRVFKARARIEEQVRLAQFLQHPAILRTYGLHKVEGTWYLLTENPVGPSLNEHLALVQECRRWFSPLFTLYVGAQVAAALAHAHTAKDESGKPLGIVHRAIDLEHVFVDWNGNVQVSDFGTALSKLRGRVASSVRRPRGGIYFGSPEMLLGARVDGRSDLFTLGLVMLEMSTGKNLLYAPDGVTPERMAKLSDKGVRQVDRAILRAHLAGYDSSLVEVIHRAATFTPEDVDAATEALPSVLRMPLRKLLQRSPDARYQTAGELEAELRASLGDTFGIDEAAAEVMEIVRETDKLMEEIDLPGTRRRSVYEVTTR